MGKKFDMGEFAKALTPVPNLGTQRQIEYIDIDKIDGDARNFYAVTQIDDLAANIELFGLQQPLLVRTSPDDPARVIIISGHRRRAAIAKLVGEGRDDLRLIPCIREQEAGSEALQELRLIYANSDTRDLSSAEVSKQAERVEALLYQLKEEGYDFPGRMRDHVAEACKVSKSKLSRLKVIRENLTPKWREAWEANKVNESVAYSVAQMPEYHQSLAMSAALRKKHLNWFYEYEAKNLGERLAKVEEKAKTCTHLPAGQRCEHVAAMLRKTAGASYGGEPCRNRCCIGCDNLIRCKESCRHAETAKARAKKQAKARKEQEKQEIAEREAPILAQLRDLWRRAAEARRTAGVEVEDLFRVTKTYYNDGTLRSYEELERGETLKAGSGTPFGYDIRLSDVNCLCMFADALDVSLDYLFGRSDTLQPMPDAPPAARWQTGTPPQSGPYWVCLEAEGVVSRMSAEWDAARGKWRGLEPEADGFSVTGWWPLPDVTEV